MTYEGRMDEIDRLVRVHGNLSHKNARWLMSEVARLREWQENAVHFIESSLKIAERSCNPGDGLDGTWGDRLIRESGKGRRDNS